MVVWMTAFVALKGQSLFDKLGGNWLPWMLFKVRVSVLAWRIS